MGWLTVGCAELIGLDEFSEAREAADPAPPEPRPDEDAEQDPEGTQGGPAAALPACSPQELLVDGGFELGSDAWVDEDSHQGDLVMHHNRLQPNAEARSGTYVAALGGPAGRKSVLSQSVRVPEDARLLTVTAYYWAFSYVETQSPARSGQDIGTLSLVRGGDRQALLLLDNLNTTNAFWRPFLQTVDATGYAGSEVKLQMEARIALDGVGQTLFLFDNVSLAVDCPEN